MRTVNSRESEIDNGKKQIFLGAREQTRKQEDITIRVQREPIITAQEPAFMTNQEFVQSQNKRVAKEEQVDLRWQKNTGHN